MDADVRHLPLHKWVTRAYKTRLRESGGYQTRICPLHTCERETCSLLASRRRYPSNTRTAAARSVCTYRLLIRPQDEVGLAPRTTGHGGNQIHVGGHSVGQQLVRGCGTHSCSASKVERYRHATTQSETKRGTDQARDRTGHDCQLYEPRPKMRMPHT
jgi:hypothetical protein